MAMTPQAAWEFTKQLSPLPGPGGAPSELEQAAQGKYADMGLPEIYPVAQIKENQQISVKVEAAKAKMAADQQAKEQGLPHPPQAPILEQLLAEERRRKGEPPMPQGQMPPQGMPHKECLHKECPSKGCLHKECLHKECLHRVCLHRGYRVRRMAASWDYRMVV